jgi:hypothetical protein
MSQHTMLPTEERHQDATIAPILSEPGLLHGDTAKPKRERGSSTHLNDASKEDNDAPRASSPPAPTKGGIDFRPQCRTPHTLSTGLG